MKHSPTTRYGGSNSSVSSLPLRRDLTHRLRWTLSSPILMLACHSWMSPYMIALILQKVTSSCTSALRRTV